MGCFESFPATRFSDLANLVNLAVAQSTAPVRMLSAEQGWELNPAPEWSSIGGRLAVNW
jgi:hypothetical protein